MRTQYYTLLFFCVKQKFSSIYLRDCGFFSKMDEVDVMIMDFDLMDKEEFVNLMNDMICLCAYVGAV